MIAVNPPWDNVRQTVGYPLPGVEVRLAADGELLVRGPLVMDGYWQNPDATAAAIPPAKGEAPGAPPWLHTGDVARIEDERIIITDRKRDFIKTLGGDMVSPAKLEALLMAEPEIAQAVVAGEGQPGLVALVVPADAHAAEVAAAIGRVNARLSSIEAHPPLAFAPAAFSVENGLLTPTMKVKRRRRCWNVTKARSWRCRIGGGGFPAPPPFGLQRGWRAGIGARASGLAVAASAATASRSSASTASSVLSQRCSSPPITAPSDRRHPEQPQLLQRPAADEQRRAGAARRVHRGVGDRDADQVDQRQAQADGDRREAGRAPRSSVAPRMTIRKKKVITTSAHQRRDHASSRRANARRSRWRRSRRARSKPGLPLAMTYSSAGAGDAAEHLGDDVGRQLGAGKRPPTTRPDRYRRVEVAAGDMADGEGHGQHGQAEGQRHAEQADADFGEGGGQHGAAATAEHQPERADEFRNELT